MERRLEFALRAQRCDNLRALWREYGISPRVGYKWKHRLLEQGAWQLAKKSRRPQSSPNGLGEEEVCHLVQLRQGHPTWGARKLQDIYRGYLQQQSYYFSRALACWGLGLKACDHESHEACFAKLLTGHLDLGRASFQPISATATSKRHVA